VSLSQLLLLLLSFCSIVLAMFCGTIARIILFVVICLFEGGSFIPNCFKINRSWLIDAAASVSSEKFVITSWNFSFLALTLRGGPDVSPPSLIISDCVLSTAMAVGSSSSSEEEDDVSDSCCVGAGEGVEGENADAIALMARPTGEKAYVIALILVGG